MILLLLLGERSRCLLLVRLLRAVFACSLSGARAEEPEKLGTVIGIDLGTTCELLRRLGLLLLSGSVESPSEYLCTPPTSSVLCRFPTSSML